MSTYFNSASASPDEKAIEAERLDLLLRIEEMQKELDLMKSNNEMLKDVIVAMSMKLVGVTN